mmetsp:Transcript_15690/g.34394  ORF Transcript_15690/g.34394 Transcript_15690/m.34394 type:complete len:369 (-) Transcript_15690:46-1152(-)
MVPSLQLRSLFLAALSLAVAEAFLKSLYDSELKDCSLDEHAISEMSSLVGRRGSKECRTMDTSTSAKKTMSVDSITLVQHEALQSARPSTAVWVTGYPRSGSSTILSMVSAAGQGLDPQVPGKVFSLFEPCHNGDKLSKKKEKEGCAGLLMGIARCNFSRVMNLWGWADPHSTNDHKPYNMTLAHKHCVTSNMIAFKSVDYAHDLQQSIWMLDEMPELRIISIIRDPRGVYASWKAMEPFATLLQQGEYYSLQEVCQNMRSNSKIQHERVHHIVLEDLVKDPRSVMQGVYAFLGMTFGQAQEDWLQKTFNAARCPEAPAWQHGYEDCHSNSSEVVEKWRQVLTAGEQQIFRSEESCQELALARGYPTE